MPVCLAAYVLSTDMALAASVQHLLVRRYVQAVGGCMRVLLFKTSTALLQQPLTG
jgi:hypothetical protein